MPARARWLWYLAVTAVAAWFGLALLFAIT